MMKWYELLGQVRMEYAVSQQELAERSHVSVASIKSYETGRRHPSRIYLTALLDSLDVDQARRNQILELAGFVADGGVRQGPQSAEREFTREGAVQAVNRLKWPALVMGEPVEVVWANEPLQRLWGVDLRREFLNPVERNFLSVCTNPRFADRIVNWDECVETILNVFKGLDMLAPENPTPYFRAVLDNFLAGDPKYVSRFTRLWEAASSRYEQPLRWSYPIVWREPGIGDLRFEGTVTPANISDVLSFNDWIPVDAETWIGLATLMRR